MLNDIHRLCFRPEREWDPIPPAHALFYSQAEWSSIDTRLGDWIGEILAQIDFGSIRNQKILDLGAGPGQYSAYFLQQGGLVTWFDISKRYREIASARIAESLPQHLQNIAFRIGYLDELPVRELGPFDIVFSRLAWCYSASEARFARLLISSLRPGGVGFVISGVGMRPNAGLIQRTLYYTNALLRFKVGHPQPPSGRVVQRLSSAGAKILDQSRQGMTEWVAFQRVQ